MGPERAVAGTPDEGAARLRAALGPGSRRLWPALDRLDWVASLPNRAAPGFVFLGGACRGTPVGGGGADLAEAAGRLAGEASEVLAQREVRETPGLAPDPALAVIWGDGPCLPGSCAATGRSVGVPLRAVSPAHPANPGAPPRSLGLAAGENSAAARFAGLLELLERDAAAAWWSGETRPRALDAVDLAASAAALCAMRGGARRPTALLALPCRLGLAVVCAMSRDPGGGGGLAFGLKAAPDLGGAAAGALRELLQMEIGLEIARMRSSGGRAEPGDAGPLARAALDPDGFEAFAALPPDTPPAEAPGFDAIVSRLDRMGIAVTVADLPGLDGGLAVAKVLAPGLRPLPGPGATPRPGSPGAAVDLM